MSKQVLSHVKVLDLTHHLSGPFCSKFLAAFGAEVIKVERPGEGDVSRRIGPFPNDEPHPEKSALFLFLNTGKKSITLDIHSPTGVEIVKKLVKEVDVLVENFQPGVLSQLGLDYETLDKINPRLIMASITNFGQSGPYRDYKANSMVEYALSGHMYITGFPHKEPLTCLEYQPEYQGGLHAFDGILGSLYWREESGQGQYIDVSIQECLAGQHEYTLANYAYRGVIQERLGNRVDIDHPITLYPCKDGWVSMSGRMSLNQEPVFLMVDRLDLMEDPRFQTARSRVEHAEELDAELMPWFLEHTKEEVFQLAQELRVLGGMVLRIEELLQNPHYKAREFWQEIEHPEVGKVIYPGGPFRMEATPWQTTRAPFLGEHNQEIYCGWLGYSKEDLVRLRGAWVI
ncbi:MAG: CoA transferase [Dehalococcoidia bacterium]